MQSVDEARKRRLKKMIARVTECTVRGHGSSGDGKAIMRLSGFSVLSCLACAALLGATTLPGCSAKVDGFVSMGADGAGTPATGGKVAVSASGGSAGSTTTPESSVTGGKGNWSLPGGSSALGGSFATGGVASTKCGDGIVQPGEQCDDGINDGSYGGCDPNCTLAGYCGDGIVQWDSGEQCDSGNTPGADCDQFCQLGPGWTADTSGNGILPCQGQPVSIDYTKYIEAAGMGSSSAIYSFERDIILVDRSLSMGDLLEGTSTTRWQVIEQGLAEFFANSHSSRQLLALAYFGKTGNSTDPGECDPATYATVAVAAVTDPQLLVEPSPVLASLQSMENSLTGRSPIYPALKGALGYAVAENYTRIILITAGSTASCNPGTFGDGDLSPSVGVAQTAAQDGITINVIGVGVDASTDLNQIALAGGTSAASVVNGPNAADQFATALTQFAFPGYGLPVSKSSNCLTALGASWDPPVNFAGAHMISQFLYADGAQDIPFVQSAADCTAQNGGFYLDRLLNPRLVGLCPCTCAYANWYVPTNQAIYLPYAPDGSWGQ